MTLPSYLLKLGRESPEHQAWVDSLPKVVQAKAQEWALKLGAPYLENASCSYVVEALTAEGEEVVLKVGFPHFEARHEIEGLRLLNGPPTVRLLHFDKAVNAMLLEKCDPGTSLQQLKLSDQDVIIGELLPEIWQSAPDTHGFSPLSEMVSLWNKETYETIDSYPYPSLAKQGCQLKEHLIHSSTNRVLLATDLHAGNILRAQRKPWLVIDIKPFVGDPAYDLTQHLINSLDSLQNHPTKRINKLADQAGVSRSRLRDWLFARLASEFGGIYQEVALSLR